MCPCIYQAPRACRWLQYHDRDTGDLCGMLPLAIGMPVALTHHLDRSPDKMLLKGTVGRVHSWVWSDNDRLAHRVPTCVYVKFEGATWQLDGIDEPGVYPIRPKKKDWYLDGKRKHSVLKIKRRQIPLTPAFAITAHASQGKTKRAIMLDLSVDKRVDTTIGAVGVSRVRSREDCLILRPFPLWLFQRGVPDGPKLLLQKLRGEDVDLVAYAEGLQACTPMQFALIVTKSGTSTASSTSSGRRCGPTCQPCACIASMARMGRASASSTQLSSTRAAPAS